MPYKNPGVRIAQIKRSVSASGVGAYLPACIIGSGLATIQKTYKLVKDTNDYNAIVDEDGEFLDISSIVRVGNTKESADYNVGTHLSDYSLDVQLIDTVSRDVIRWNSVGGEVTPSEGDTFYITVEVTPASDHYELKMMSSREAVEEEYGADVVSGVINPISLAAQIALENTAFVYTLKAAKSGSDLTQAELQTALEKIKADSSVYRLVIADAPNTDLNLALINHVKLMSDPEEGMERVALLAAQHTSSNVTDVVTNVGGYATALGEFRVGVVYPDKAKRVLSDGVEYSLTGGYIAAALAGKKASLRPEEAYTAKKITNFSELVGVRMTRSEKNTLAGNGVMILTQEKRGYPIEVRHGISSDMTNLQSKEISVTELADYVARVIRPALKAYKGKNITQSLVDQVEGSVNSTLFELTRKGHVLAGSRVTQISQVENALDTLAVAINVKVPYPCNNIDVVVTYD